MCPQLTLSDSSMTQESYIGCQEGVWESKGNLESVWALKWGLGFLDYILASLLFILLNRYATPFFFSYKS